MQILQAFMRLLIYLCYSWSLKYARLTYRHPKRLWEDCPLEVWWTWHVDLPRRIASGSDCALENYSSLPTLTLSYFLLTPAYLAMATYSELSQPLKASARTSGICSKHSCPSHYDRCRRISSTSSLFLFCWWSQVDKGRYLLKDSFADWPY